MSSQPIGYAAVANRRKNTEVNRNPRIAVAHRVTEDNRSGVVPSRGARTTSMSCDTRNWRQQEENGRPERKFQLRWLPQIGVTKNKMVETFITSWITSRNRAQITASTKLIQR